MTELSCGYGDDRDEAIVAFLYDDAEGSPADQARFETHLQTCARCRADVAALRGVRAQLARWSPPEPSFAVRTPQSAIRNPPWWRDIPAWAQVAAALLFLGVSAGVANLDVRYDHNGLSIRTGWSTRPGGSGEAGGAGRSGATKVAQDQQASGGGTAPWRADLAALERQLKTEFRASQASAMTAPAQTVRAVSATDADVIRRVRALVEDSEKRQQRELALRIAGLLRDVNAQRQADLVKIDRTLGVVQNSVGIEVMKNRQQLNQMDLLYRASQKQ
jgi:anti-sigma factor RsiW